MAPRGRPQAPSRGSRPGVGRTRGRGSPSASRPRATSRTRTTAQAERPRTRYTNRMALLVLVFAVLAISYASSMRAYLNQRDHLSDLRAQIASSSKKIDGLKREKQRWDDKAFLQAQARERFGWVMPGEVAYQVLDGQGKPLTGEQRLTDPDSVAPRAPEAWWSRAQTSLDAADHPEKYAPPTGTITPQSAGAND